MPDGFHPAIAAAIGETIGTPYTTPAERTYDVDGETRSVQVAAELRSVTA